MFKLFPSLRNPCLLLSTSGQTRCRDIQASRKKALETLWRQMEDVICVLWPDTLIFQYGSLAVTGMMTPGSDVDVMVSA